jgi:hypothetical protein
MSLAYDVESGNSHTHFKNKNLSFKICGEYYIRNVVLEKDGEDQLDQSCEK